MYTCYIQSFKILVSFCSWAGWSEPYLVKNPGSYIFTWCGSIIMYTSHVQLSSSPISLILHEKTRRFVEKMVKVTSILRYWFVNMMTSFIISMWGLWNFVSDFSQSWLADCEIRNCFHHSGTGVLSLLRMRVAAGSVLIRVLTGTKKKLFLFFLIEWCCCSFFFLIIHSYIFFI